RGRPLRIDLGSRYQERSSALLRKAQGHQRQRLLCLAGVAQWQGSVFTAGRYDIRDRTGTEAQNRTRKYPERRHRLLRLTRNRRWKNLLALTVAFVLHRGDQELTTESQKHRGNTEKSSEYPRRTNP